jgi:transposase
LADIWIIRRNGGMPRTRPDRMLADKAYSTQKVRDALRCRGIEATIPEPANQIAGRGMRGSKGGLAPEVR